MPTPTPPSQPLPSDLEIARATTLLPITEVADAAGLPPDRIEPYGRHVAKIDLGAIDDLEDRPRAKYVVVTAVTP
ncbi:MAG: formate--tetrahydrofolate ligase, partial [Nostocoides sp.]